MAKIEEANVVAYARNSSVKFEFAFIREDTMFVKVIRQEKYRAYWKSSHFYTMLDAMILTEEVSLFRKNTKRTWFVGTVKDTVSI